MNEGTKDIFLDLIIEFSTTKVRKHLLKLAPYTNKM